MKKRKVTLPSGKKIEISYFEQEVQQIETVGKIPSKGCVQGSDLNLHICPMCGKDKMRPIEWEEHDDDHWEILLSCPECDPLMEIPQRVIAPQCDCDLFDDHLENGSDALTRDYKRLMTANLAEEIERFVHALEHDLILPEDF